MAGINLGIGLPDYWVAFGVDKTDAVFSFLKIIETKTPGMIAPEDVTFAAAGVVGRGI